MSISKYLFEKVDEKICLYRGFRFFDTRFNEQDMTLVDLNSFCDEVREINYTAEDKIFEVCSNVMRFTEIDLVGETPVREFWDTVNCE